MLRILEFFPDSNVLDAWLSIKESKRRLRSRSVGKTSTHNEGLLHPAQLSHPTTYHFLDPIRFWRPTKSKPRSQVLQQRREGKLSLDGVADYKVRSTALAKQRPHLGHRLDDRKEPLGLDQCSNVCRIFSFHWHIEVVTWEISVAYYLALTLKTEPLNAHRFDPTEAAWWK